MCLIRKLEIINHKSGPTCMSGEPNIVSYVIVKDCVEPP